MAFNPFDSFRKHSKYIFATMVGVAMLTFVFSSGLGGRGDLFTQIGDSVGMGGNTTLVTVGGKKYDGRQIAEIRSKRFLASRYMELATAFAQNSLAGKAQAGMAKLDPGAKPLVNRIVETRMYASMMPQMFGEQYRSLLQNSGMYRQFLRQYQANANRDKKTDDLNTLVAVEDMLDLDARLMGKEPGESYFGGKLTDDPDFEQMSNYLLWMHEADQLGIQLNQNGIRDAIAVETYRELNTESAQRINEIMQREVRGYNIDSLYEALGDEIRVRMAQSSMLGLSQRLRRSVPYVNTPEEAWELFRDARTAIIAGLIEVPVEPYVAQVKGNPTEDELKALFQKYKTFTPAPDRAEPGFKEPRKVQVEWVSADANLPFYAEAAKKLAPLSLAVAQIGGGPASALGGSTTGVAESINAITALAFPDSPLFAELERYRDREVPWTNITPTLHDSSVLRAENFMSLLGAAAGAAGTGAPAGLVGPLAMEARAIVREIRNRAKVGASMILTGALDPAPLGIDGIPRLVMPNPLSLEELRGQLQAKLASAYTKKLVTEDATMLGREVARLGKENDKAAVKKYIDEFVKLRGWNRGSTTESRDQFDLAKDAGLAPLRDAYVRGHGSQDALLRNFAGPFFQETTQFGPPIAAYTPQSYPAAFGDEKQIYFWRTDDKAERVPSFEKAKPQVEAAWKLEKARELAKQEADRIAALAKPMSGNEPKLRDLAVSSGNRPFLKLGPMAPRMPTLNPTPGQPRQYGSYAVPPELVAYPGPAMLGSLLDLRKEPIGSTTVVSDQPKMHYYAASEMSRGEPLQDEFRRAYVNSMTTAPEFDGLLLDLSFDGMVKYRNELMKQLRAEAKVTVNPEVLKRDAGKESQ